VETFVKEAIAN